MAKERVYKKGAPGSEYDAYHGKKEQKKRRAQRNKARRKAERLLNERKKKERTIDIEAQRLSRIRRRSLREQAKVQEIQDELQGYIP